MTRFKLSETVRLVLNVIVISLFIGGAVFLVKKCSTPQLSKEWELEKHPLKVESIRKIAEISTVSYQDEVVIDTIEYYDGVDEQLIGNVTKLIDPEGWKYSLRGSAIKRRLTLIIGGEARLGFDLNNDKFSIRYSQDTAFVTVSQPQILSITIPPSKTTVFLEHGTWHDNTRKHMQNKAMRIFKKRVEELNLDEKVKLQLETVLRKMITNKTLQISYQ
jgi:hypothetical protein